MKYVDPDGRALNFIIGAVAGFISSAATEIGGRMTAGQSFAEVVHNTFTDKTSLAVIGSSTAIGAVTSGVSDIATKSVATAVTAVAKQGAISGIQAITQTTVKTVAVNTLAGAMDAGAKGIAVKAMKGEAQSAVGTVSAMGEGALTAILASSATQSIIANSSTTSGQIGNLLTGSMQDFNINQPGWAGTAGVVGENVIPTMIDIKKSWNGE